MNSLVQRIRAGMVVGLTVLFLDCSRVVAADTLSWPAGSDRISADIRSTDLFVVLARIAEATGWNVFVEADTAHTVSAKFRDLGMGDALHRLLGDVNFVLIPATNSPSKLFVFHSVMQNATQMIRPPPRPSERSSQAKIIPNELLVRLKPGANIDDIARQLGAKVVGRIDGLNAYRLRFDDAESANDARKELAANSDVASVDSNYSIDRPTTLTQSIPTAVPPPQLQLKPPPNDCRVIVGVVDTGMQPLGNNLDQFVLKSISVAGDAQPDSGTPSHATSMAETMLRSLQGATKGITSVQILPVDVYGARTSTSTFDVANGIAQAVNNGAKIVNLSLGSDVGSPFLHGVIQDATSKNILFVGAAGNTPVTTPFYPAAYPEVNAVTAIENGKLAPYANRGSFVSLGAPGSSIINYNNQSWYVAGTSASAAFTSGIAAAYLEANPCSPISDSRAFLRQNLGVTITTGP
jgi:hypothetical protein